MGHRLISALTLLNAMMLLACIILIAAGISKDPEIAVPVVRAIQGSIWMFVAGSALPTVAWGISAMELKRSSDTIRSIESWTIYILLLTSLVMFTVGSWRLPSSVLGGLS